jgi:hypothetical protein
MRKSGAVGRRYYEEKNHGNHGAAGIIFKGKPDVDLAVELLNKCAELAVPALESSVHYRKRLGEHPTEFRSRTGRRRNSYRTSSRPSSGMLHEIDKLAGRLKCPVECPRSLVEIFIQGEGK